MSVFDSIIDGISSIGDWVSDIDMNDLDFVGDIAKKGFRAYESLHAKDKEQRNYAQRYGMDNVSMASVNNNFKAGETQYGITNFAPDPAALEAYWGNVIQKFIQTAKTGGK